MSIGRVSSYLNISQGERKRKHCQKIVYMEIIVKTHKAGASNRIAMVPTSEAIEKIHRNRRSKTIATNPQS